MAYDLPRALATRKLTLGRYREETMGIARYRAGEEACGFTAGFRELRSLPAQHTGILLQAWTPLSVSLATFTSISPMGRLLFSSL